MSVRSATNQISKQIVFRSFLHKYRTIIIDVISGLFIVLFLYTALSKSFDIQRTVAVVKQTPYVSNYSKVIAWSIVILEYIVTALLIIPKSRILGLYSSTGLMLLFTAYIIFMKATMPYLPCSCGGVISKMTWNQHLVFNIVFTLIALTGSLLSRKPTKKSENLV